MLCGILKMRSWIHAMIYEYDTGIRWLNSGKLFDADPEVSCPRGIERSMKISIAEFRISSAACEYLLKSYNELYESDRLETEGAEADAQNFGAGWCGYPEERE